jgi:hypothetical protein
LRQPGQPWPGLNTRGGRIDNGSGQLEDGSINMIINEADILEKRKGMVRGLNERFNGVVCGLFTYTSLCGLESLLVADETQISIRTPFVVPVFENSDAYPFDAFNVDGDPNSDNWRNTGDYTVRDEGLFLASGASVFSGSSFPVSRLMRWFKDASNKSFQVRVEYEFDDGIDGEQRISISIKGSGDLSSGALLKADLIFDRSTGKYEVELYHRASSGSESLFLSSAVSGTTTPAGGFFTLRYTRDTALNTFIPSIFVVPTGGSIVDSAAPTLSVIEDLDLGQVSAIGEGYRTTFPTDMQIKVVDGGPVS